MNPSRSPVGLTKEALEKRCQGYVVLCAEAVSGWVRMCGVVSVWKQKAALGNMVVLLFR